MSGVQSWGAGKKSSSAGWGKGASPGPILRQHALWVGTIPGSPRPPHTLRMGGRVSGYATLSGDCFLRRRIMPMPTSPAANRASGDGIGTGVTPNGVG